MLSMVRDGVDMFWGKLFEQQQLFNVVVRNHLLSLRWMGINKNNTNIIHQPVNAMYTAV